jgi:hypothetical protein
MDAMPNPHHKWGAGAIANQASHVLKDSVRATWQKEGWVNSQHAPGKGAGYREIGAIFMSTLTSISNMWPYPTRSMHIAANVFFPQGITQITALHASHACSKAVVYRPHVLTSWCFQLHFKMPQEGTRGLCLGPPFQQTSKVSRITFPP